MVSAEHADRLHVLDQLGSPDLEKAKAWYKAADAGDTDAMKNLGLLLANLDPPDVDGARTWYAKAGIHQAMHRGDHRASVGPAVHRHVTKHVPPKLVRRRPERFTRYRESRRAPLFAVLQLGITPSSAR